VVAHRQAAAENPEKAIDLSAGQGLVVAVDTQSAAAALSELENSR